MSSNIDPIRFYKQEVDSIVFKILQKTITEDQLIERLNHISKDMSRIISTYDSLNQIKKKYFSPRSEKNQMKLLPKIRNYNETTHTPACSVDDGSNFIPDETCIFGSLRDSPLTGMSSPTLMYHLAQSPKMSFML